MHPKYRPPQYASYPAGTEITDFDDLNELVEAEDSAADEEYDRRRDEAMDELRRMEEA
jgi:hypothetical protein